ncbi:MAG TPA: PA0069 family radical SAM protein [Steroidobacteraceae bacterium]|nr:PA0069 family radical SAM protein [Steroidobacteraceae bacterium]
MTRAIIGQNVLKGRGALSNPQGRFDRTGLEAVDDGWYQEEAPDSVATSVQPDRARGVISTNDSPDIGFDQSINPYRGCEHGCIYCYARPSHSYMGLSPGIDFETKLFYKADAATVLESELARPRYVCKPIMLGANTDPYQPVERRLEVTRSILKVLADCHHPVTIVTKGVLIARDLDILTTMAREQLVSVAVSLTTLDAETKRTLEPRAASPQARLKTIRMLADAGVPVRVMVAPVVPAITDHETESILGAAAAAGAVAASYVLLRLPYEVKDLFREWLAQHYPERAQHVMSLVRDARGGRDNDPNFGTRMRGTGAYAELIRARFKVASRKLGLNAERSRALDTTLFRPPRAGSPQLQLEL